MKKKVIIGIISVLVVISGCLFVMFNSSNKSYYVITNNNEEKIMNTNALTMMYETEAGSGEYQVTSDTTWPQEGYVFNERLSKCENGSELSWDDENKVVLMQANVSDKCYVYFDVYVEPTFAEICKEKKSNTLACKVATTYTTDGENGLYYHDGVGNYTNADQEAGDNSYRFSGADPNNYVCFGSDATSCPADNLYRIIGVFGNQVKLIKHDYAGESTLGTAPASNGRPNSSYYKGSLSIIPYYRWSGSSSNQSNTWSSSTLNTSILNGTYLNTLGSEWTSKIATTSWKVGGNTFSNTYIAPVKTAYTNEIVSPTENTTYSAKIGLMYVSDYGYAASPENWSTNLGDYNNDTNRFNNWMYMGASEWTISRRSDNTYQAFYVLDDGGVDYLSYVSFSHGVRPSFSLESSVVLSGGSGSSADPYRIALDSFDFS